jgi:dipeptidyl aminopeptidase/acylaminoacyl peptidase
VRRPRLLVSALFLIGWFFAPIPVDAATRYDPRLRFETITTPHFVIYFHQGTEAQARRLAVIAEEVHATLTEWLPPGSRGRTHVVLVDQTDLANGWATPIPFNLIEVSAAAPPGERMIGNTDDWLRLVFTHEYTHVLHLDRSRGWAAGVRRLFGRTPLAFPNLFLPGWQIEGIATYQESATTGVGRVPAGDFAKLLRVAAREDRIEPLDRTNGGLVDWPSGATHYLYGAYFHEYLAARFGNEQLAALADATAGRLPYVGTRAFRSVFGQSLGSLWREFTAELRDGAPGDSAGLPAAQAPTSRRLTHHGWVVEAPRWDRHGDTPRILYSVRNPHGFPALMAISPDEARPREQTTRFLGERIAVAVQGVYFDQIEIVRNVALHSDLYFLERTPDNRLAGRARRLTRGARIVDPDLSPDGGTLACVVFEPGRRSLAIMPLDRTTPDGTAPRAPLVLATEPETQFASPRWSPDGRHVAAERRRLHGPSEIVLVDPATREIRTLISSRGGRNTGPVWTPDGRTVIFAASGDRGPFNLYAVDVDSGALFQITGLASGARSPDVSPDGATIAYIGYTVDGYDLFTMPLDRTGWREAAHGRADPVAAPSPHVDLGDPSPPNHGAPAGATPFDAAALDVEAYSVWPSLLPRTWSPLLDYEHEALKVGAATGGVDVLGRHGYAVGGLWNVEAAVLDWFASYVYDRWRPSVFAVASDERTPVGEHRLRELALETGVLLPLRRVRHSHSWFTSLRTQRASWACADGHANACAPRPAVDRRALRFGWAFSSARQYGYSISAEDGTRAALTTEHVRPALGSSGSADAYTAELRTYLPGGLRRTTVALRAAGGTSNGDPQVQRFFTLGGSGPRQGLLGYGRDHLGLLRGFDTGTFVGRRLVAANADYRIPLAFIERGRGTWPIFLRTLHAAAFVDAGHVWNDAFDAADLKTSLGAELSLDTVIGYFAPITFTAGVAWRHDGARRHPGGPAFFARVGRAF